MSTIPAAKGMIFERTVSNGLCDTPKHQGLWDGRHIDIVDRANEFQRILKIVFKHDEKCTITKGILFRQS